MHASQFLVGCRSPCTSVHSLASPYKFFKIKAFCNRAFKATNAQLANPCNP